MQFLSVIMIALARFHPKSYYPKLYSFVLQVSNGLPIYSGCLKHAKESHHNPSTRFCSYNVIIIHLINNVSSSFIKDIEFYDLWFLLNITDRFPCKRRDIDNTATFFCSLTCFWLYMTLKHISFFIFFKMTGCTKFISIFCIKKLWWNTLHSFLQYFYSLYILS